MNCYNHDDEFCEVVKNDDGTYERWCDCGYHEIIKQDEGAP